MAHRVGRRLLELLQEVEVREGLALRGQLRLARAKEEHAHEVALAAEHAVLHAREDALERLREARRAAAGGRLAHVGARVDHEED